MAVGVQIRASRLHWIETQLSMLPLRISLVRKLFYFGSHTRSRA